jgi:hypothetical protein
MHASLPPRSLRVSHAPYLVDKAPEERQVDEVPVPLVDLGRAGEQPVPDWDWGTPQPERRAR